MSRVQRLNSEEWLKLAEDSGYRTEDLSQELRIGPRQLRRLIWARFGQSPQSWLKELRLCAAFKLLLQLDSPKAAAISLGFKQLSHFSREFKLRYGLSPSQFVRQQKMQNVRPR